MTTLAFDWETLFVVPNVIFTVGGIIAIISVITCSVSGVCRTKAREQTKREMAAYVAEGSMTPEDATRILNSGPRDEDEKIA